MKPEHLPMVSCIMPTRNRPHLAALAVQNFLAQSWPSSRRELVIVDDSDTPITPGLEGQINHRKLSWKAKCGEKMNIACQLALGEIIVKWDDDDWSGPHRVRSQVEPIILGRADMTSFSYDEILKLPERQWWTARRSVLHSLNVAPLAFKKEVWRKHGPFQPTVADHTRTLMDNATYAGRRMEQLNSHGHFVYVRHQSNGWRMASSMVKRFVRPPGMKLETVDRYALASAGDTK